MPRNVRNFWIEARVDGRSTEIAAGPRAKDGGFNLTVYMRDEGKVVRALEVSGRATENGELILAVDRSFIPEAWRINDGYTEHKTKR